MRFRLLPSLLLAVILAACSTAPSKPSLTPAQQAAEAAFRQAEQLSQAFASANGRDRAALARQIEAELAALGNADLAQRTAALPAGSPLYAFAGRELLKRGLPLPRPFDTERGNLAAELPPADRDGYRPPLRVAVLLPMSGSLASAGNSVRDGFLAGYYGETRRRPQLSFHDTSTGVANAARAAVADGAQLIVGPLGREEVNALVDSADRLPPLLLLNRPQQWLPDDSISYALSPEDEGAAAAERLLARGLRRAIAFGQDDDNSRRAIASFTATLRARGGEMLADIAVAEGKADLTGELQRARAAGGAQAVFLALKAPQARLLSAQLKTGELAPLPRVATSLVLAGGGNARLDAELDGIEYPELPWLLGLGSGLPEAASLGSQLGSARGTAQRLFAFGHDAWKLAAYFEKLATDPGASLRGVTGVLRIDSQGLVKRDPAWAVFSGGRPRLAPQGAPVADAAGH